MKVFEITNDHLKLLNHMWIGWNDCEFGAPEVDPKRPYGNSNVYDDIAAINAEVKQLRKQLEELDDESTTD